MATAKGMVNPDQTNTSSSGRKLSNEFDLGLFNIDAAALAQELLTAANAEGPSTTSQTREFNHPKTPVRNPSYKTSEKSSFDKKCSSSKVLSPPVSLMPELTGSVANVPSFPIIDEPKHSNSSIYQHSSIKKRKSSDISGSVFSSSLSKYKRDDLHISSPSSSPSPSSSSTTVSSTLSSTSSSSSSLSTTSSHFAKKKVSLNKKVLDSSKNGKVYECVLMKRDGGLGLTLACVDGRVQITGLAQDSPAANSGIAVGDILVAVGGVAVQGLSFQSIITRLKSSTRRSVLKLRRRTRAGSKTIDTHDLSHRSSLRLRDSSSNSSSISSLSKLSSNTTSNNERKTDTKALMERAVKAISSLTSSRNAQRLESRRQLHRDIPIGIQKCSITSQVLNETIFLKEPMWTLKVCQSDRDRYFAEARHLRKQLTECMDYNEMEKRSLQSCLQKLKELIEETKQNKEMTINLAEQNGDDIETLRKKLFSSRAKIRELEVREARRAAEATSLAANEKRHAVSEAERVRMAIIYQLKTQMQLMEMDSSQRNVDLHLNGIRSCVFNLIFPDINLEHVSLYRLTHEFKINSDLLLHSFGWNFKETIYRDMRSYIVHMSTPLKIQYNIETCVLEISCKIEVEVIKSLIDDDEISNSLMISLKDSPICDLSNEKHNTLGDFMNEINSSMESKNSILSPSSLKATSTSTATPTTTATTIKESSSSSLIENTNETRTKIVSSNDLVSEPSIKPEPELLNMSS